MFVKILTALALVTLVHADGLKLSEAERLSQLAASAIASAKCVGELCATEAAACYADKACFAAIATGGSDGSELQKCAAGKKVEACVIKELATDTTPSPTDSNPLPEVVAGTICADKLCATEYTECTADTTGCLLEIGAGGSAGSTFKTCTKGAEYIKCYATELGKAGGSFTPEQIAAGVKCTTALCKTETAACAADKACFAVIATGGSDGSELQKCTAGEKVAACVSKELATDTNAAGGSLTPEQIAAGTKCATTICATEAIACYADTACAAAIMTGGSDGSALQKCAAGEKVEACVLKELATDTTPAPTDTAPKTISKKDQVSGAITTMKGLLGGALSKETMDLLQVGFDKLIETEDVNGTDAILAMGTAMALEGKSMTDVVKNKEFTALIAKYGIDIKALIKSINNPFKTIDGGKQTLDFDVVLDALNLTADMTKTLSGFMQKHVKVMDAAKEKVATEGKGKGWLTKYGTLNMDKFMQDADVAAALEEYAAENDENAKGVANLKTAVAASTAADEAAGAALDPVVTDDSSASTTAASFVTVAAAVFMAL